MNGWKTVTKDYIENVKLCQEAILKDVEIADIKSSVFRPPYGRIKPSQARELNKLGYNIIMWDVLSADFDTKISPEKCFENVVKNVEPGIIIVFHDSEKAFKNLEYALPRSLAYLKESGFNFDVI